MQVDDVTAAVTAAVEAAAAASDLDVCRAADQWIIMQEQLTAAFSSIDRLLCAVGIPERQFTSADERSSRAAADVAFAAMMSSKKSKVQFHQMAPSVVADMCRAGTTADRKAACARLQAACSSTRARQFEQAKRSLDERRHAQEKWQHLVVLCCQMGQYCDAS
jgi:hypothetical protein